MKKIFLLILITVIVSIPNKAKADIIGNVGSLASFANTGSTSRQVCATSTLPVAGTFTSISYIIDSTTATKAGVALYADNGSSRPGTLLVSNSPTPTNMPATKSWATSTISYTGTAGTIYWMCVWGGSTGTSNVYYSATSGFNYVFGASNALSWETWASPFITNTSSPTRRLGIYATYTPTNTTKGVNMLMGMSF